MIEEDYLGQLNEQQRAAVSYIDGPSLVIAGAGSGKTRVLTYKIVHLLAHGYEPWRILALTFTNKAAREMRSRIEILVGPRTASRLWMGTFHSIFARILRTNADKIGFKSSFTIYDAADSKALVKSIIKEMELDEKVYRPSVVLSAISSAKNALVSPQKYAASADILEADRRARRPELHSIYSAYCNRCFRAGVMDFDDLLYYTNVLLRDNPDVLRHYREFFRYVLVDEYQDTNFAQHLIVAQLTKESHKLCVVGDDAQSIYSFRGANIRNILTLRESYPDLTTFKLEQNYRSTQNIIGAANSLIEKNTEQIRKHVFSLNEPGPRIDVESSYSDYEEGYLVANRIALLRGQQHDSLEEYAILYRTNAQSRVLEESLRKRNIPYRIYGGLSFYQRKEVKDSIAYFRLSVNPDDDEALKRVINYPARGIGETSINRLSRAAIDAGVSIWTVICNPDEYPAGLGTAALKKIAAFRGLIEEFTDYNALGEDAATVARKIIVKSQLLAILINDRTPESISRQQNLEELLNAATEFVEGKMEEGEEAAVTMSDFLSEASLATDQDMTGDTGDGQTQERVTLMTVHAAKGLEFANVFIVGVEEDLFPSMMSQESLAQIEEERRLLYVAITRAKRFCMMSFAKSRFRNGQTVYPKPSRFLRDIDGRFLSGDTPKPALPEPRRQQPVASISGSAHAVDELTVGTEIEHTRFGRGTIAEIDTSQPDARIAVEFEHSGRKTLLLKFARFTILS